MENFNWEPVRNWFCRHWYHILLCLVLVSLLPIMCESTAAIISAEPLLLVVALGGLCAIVLVRLFGIRRVLQTVIAFLVYVLLMERVREEGLMAEYEGISFILELPLNIFEWVGNFINEVLAAPEEFCQGAIDALQNVVDKLLSSGDFEGFLQVIKNDVLDKVLALIQEILGIEAETTIAPVFENAAAEIITKN